MSDHLTTSGFTIVLLDDDGRKVERIPDTFLGDSQLSIGDHGYVFVCQSDDADDIVRYFQRVKSRR